MWNLPPPLAPVGIAHWEMVGTTEQFFGLRLETPRESKSADRVEVSCRRVGNFLPFRPRIVSLENPSFIPLSQFGSDYSIFYIVFRPVHSFLTIQNCGIGDGGSDSLNKKRIIPSPPVHKTLKGCICLHILHIVQWFTKKNSLQVT